MNTEKPKKPLWTTLLKASAFIVVLAAAALVVPTKLVELSIKALLHSESKETTLVMVTEPKPAGEFVTARQEIMIEGNVVNKKFIFNKRLLWQGYYTVKAGFDIQRSLKVKSSFFPPQVAIYLPEPEILSVAQKNFRVVIDEDSIFNSFSPKEREGYMQQMLQSAKDSAQESDIRQVAIAEANRLLAAVGGVLPVQVLLKVGDTWVRAGDFEATSVINPNLVVQK
ncbi:DUF4230 domain-containing protein [Oligoflexia bacterium]|nr:DUF4230 domain-containing protein [Oligoflexia bacterium]